MSEYFEQVSIGDRFEFGNNWKKYLRGINQDKIIQAENSLKQAFGVNNLIGVKFLDVGSGSGLFSLAAKRLGANVVSFDFDPNSVECTKYLKNTYFQGDNEWDVLEGSILDSEFIYGLGKFDIVYSWGVLHHTGSMWKAIDNCCQLLNDNALFYLAIYNDSGLKSKVWRAVKSLYCKNKLLRPIILFLSFFALRVGWIFRGLIKLDINFRFREYGVNARGMSAFSDLVDWVGGYPYEVCRPEEIVSFMLGKCYYLTHLKTFSGGLDVMSLFFLVLIDWCETNRCVEFLACLLQRGFQMKTGLQAWLKPNNIEGQMAWAFMLIA